jgi:phosphohistidine phosphatase
MEPSREGDAERVMKLYLIRHGIAFERDPERWPDDGDRPLTPEGEDRFRAVARGLGRIAPKVEANLASPLVRAWRTAELLAEEVKWPDPTSTPALGSGAGPDVIVDVLRGGGWSSAALVGHEPDLSRLASYLLSGSATAVPIEMKKGGVVCLGLDGGAVPGSALLRWLASPKLLRAVGG